MSFEITLQNLVNAQGQTLTWISIQVKQGNKRKVCKHVNILHGAFYSPFESV